MKFKAILVLFTSAVLCRSSSASDAQTLGILDAKNGHQPTWLVRVKRDKQNGCAAALDALTNYANSRTAMAVTPRLLQSERNCFIKFSSSSSDAEQLEAAFDWVDSVEPDLKVSSCSVYAWGLDRIDQTSLPLDKKPYDPAFTGKGATIYVLDTGIYLENEEFLDSSGTATRFSRGADFVNEGFVGDGNGHGTHVASLAAGNTLGSAPGANVVSVKVLGEKGEGGTSGVIEGIHWVMNQTAMSKTTSSSIISMSLGGAYSDFFNSVVADAVDAGLSVVVAAGNDAEDACLKSPSSATAAITVGATTSTDQMASYSNYGKCVDIYAPGSSIPGALKGSTYGVILMSGTSMATPATSGALALQLEKHKFNQNKARQELLQYTSHNQIQGTHAGPSTQLLKVQRAGTTLVPTPQPTMMPTNQPVELCLWDGVQVCFTFAASTFGPQILPASEPLVAEIAHADTDLCTLPSKVEQKQLKGKIALIDRGNCAYVTKAENAQKSGAVAALFRLMDASSSLIDPVSFGNFIPSIPSALIKYVDGQHLVTYYLGKEMYWGHGPMPRSLTKSPTSKPTKEGTDCSSLSSQKKKCKRSRFCKWAGKDGCQLKTAYQSHHF